MGLKSVTLSAAIEQQSDQTTACLARRSHYETDLSAAMPGIEGALLEHDRTEEGLSIGISTLDVRLGSPGSSVSRVNFGSRWGGALLSSDSERLRDRVR